MSLVEPDLGDEDGTNRSNVNTTSYYEDKAIGYSFRVVRGNETAWLSPKEPRPGLVEIKVGVLLPFHQTDSNWTRQLTLSGISAVRLAVAEINVHELIPGAYITLIEKDSYPRPVGGQSAIMDAVSAAVSLIQYGVVGVIGDISSSWTSLSALLTSTLQIPQCSFTSIATSLSDKSQYNHFFRTVQTQLLYADAGLSLVVSQGWPQLGVLYSDDDFGISLSRYAIMQAKSKGINVKGYQSFYGSNSEPSKTYQEIKNFLSSGINIVLIAAQGDAHISALIAAAAEGYVNNNHVWIVLNTLNSTELFAATDRFNRIMNTRLQANGHGSSSWTDVIEYSAWTTSRLQTLNASSIFAGGIFSFAAGCNLTGYQPYEDFRAKWAKLDPQLYPYGGVQDVSSNEGLAYSCMMAMARGFDKVVGNDSFPSRTEGLHKLASGQLGSVLLPEAFNTGFISPIGPVQFDSNGDRMLGNFRIYNMQNGSNVEIGNLFAGKLNLAKQPIYHDGSTTPPTGLPQKILMNPGYRTGLSLAIVSFGAIGLFLSLCFAAVFIAYRKTAVFTTSGPLFYLLELLGFSLTFICVFFFAADRSQVDCYVIPITFHIGYDLALANIIVRLYRAYHIQNNVYIKSTGATGKILIQTSNAIVLVVGAILALWLTLCDVHVVQIPVSPKMYYEKCAYDGKLYSFVLSAAVLLASSLLALATYLAIRTRSIIKAYPQHSECKRIDLAVYNIAFSTIVGFGVFISPSADYFAHHYLSGAMIVWGSFVSILILCLPKLHAIVLLIRKKRNPGRLSGLYQTFNWRKPAEENELVSINRMIANPNLSFANRFTTSTAPNVPTNIHQRHTFRSGDSSKGYTSEAYEASMPVQVLFRYFPFLGVWDMKHIVLFPHVGYFSFVSEKSHRGWVFHYKQAEVIPSSDGGYVLKVKGNGWFDVLLQVAKQEDLQLWCTRLNIAARRQKHDLETMEWQSAKTSAFHHSTQSSHLSSGEAQLPLEELLNLEHEHKRRLQNTSDL